MGRLCGKNVFGFLDEILESQSGSIVNDSGFFVYVCISPPQCIDLSIVICALILGLLTCSQLFKYHCISQGEVFLVNILVSKQSGRTYEPIVILETLTHCAKLLKFTPCLPIQFECIR